MLHSHANKAHLNWIERERERERDTDIERETERETQTDRERERERERDDSCYLRLSTNNYLKNSHFIIVAEEYNAAI